MARYMNSYGLWSISIESAKPLSGTIKISICIGNYYNEV